MNFTFKDSFFGLVKLLQQKKNPITWHENKKKTLKDVDLLVYFLKVKWSLLFLATAQLTFSPQCSGPLCTAVSIGWWMGTWEFVLRCPCTRLPLPDTGDSAQSTCHLSPKLDPGLWVFWGRASSCSSAGLEAKALLSQLPKCGTRITGFALCPPSTRYLKTQICTCKLGFTERGQG